MGAEFLRVGRKSATTFRAAFHFEFSRFTLPLKLGARRGDFAWQLRIGRVKLQRSLVSAQCVLWPAGTHIAVTNPAKAKHPGQLSAVRIASQWLGRVVGPESVIITLQTQIRSPQNVAGGEKFRIHFDGGF